MAAYLGTSEFAATVLRSLARGSHRPDLVITPPDRPRGRGRKLASPPAADAARELGIELHQTESVNRPDSTEAVLAAGGPAVVCAFGQLIKEPLLSDLEMLGVHPSLLPRWRGAAPIERAMIAGDAETGVSIMRVTEELDAGPVALQDRLEIGADEDFGSLSARLAQMSGRLAAQALELHASGDLDFAEQDEEHVTYAEKLAPEDRRLDPSVPAAELAARVRALTPHIGAYVELAGGERLGVRAARAEPGGDPETGRLAARDGALWLGAGEGALRIEVVQPPGKREMPAADYLRGHQTPPALASS